MIYTKNAVTLYFWFAANDTNGSGADGATPVFDVRLAGAASSAAPVLSGSATLLTHASYPDGCHEVAVAVNTGNGFVTGSSYAVYSTLAVDSQNPSGLIGRFKIIPESSAETKHRHALGDRVTFWFTTNDAFGSGMDATSVAYAVRKGGATAGAAPVATGNATLLTDSGFSAGCYEVSFLASDPTYETDASYSVFIAGDVDNMTPSLMIGSVTLGDGDGGGGGGGGANADSIALVNPCPVYYGDFEQGAIVRVYFTTLGTLSDAEIVVYPIDSETQIEIDLGAHLNIDFDGVTGLNQLDVALSEHAEFIVGQDYNIVLLEGEVEGETVGPRVLGCFSIENRHARGIAAW